MRFLNKLPSLSNVAAGAQATLNCPLGLRYDAIHLNHNVADLTKIKNIDVLVNGKVIQSFKDAQQLQDINDYYGRFEPASGTVTIWFFRPEMATPFDRRLAALGTADVQTLSVRMDLDGTLVSPTIEAYAMQGPQEPMGLITKIKSFSSSHAVSGKIEIDNIVRTARVAAIHLFKADVTAVELDVNTRRVYESGKTLGETIQKQYGRVPQTATSTHVDFLLEGDIAEGLILDPSQVFDFRIRPTLGTSGALQTVVEYLDGFAGI